MNRSKRGVSLMELMIVILIIAVLVGLLVPATILIRKRAAETKVRSARITLRNALLNFHAEYGLWPVGNQEDKASFKSSEVILALRPTGLHNIRNKLFWEGEDMITDLNGREYSVVIKPDGKKPISLKENIDFNDQYTVSFELK
jgi:prepilin-type N-terminal cleavage/methylation domain-containing protein